jgi:hypothetical protein
MWQWPLFYPLPAVLLVSPLAVLPFGLARALWAMISAGLFVYAARRTARPLWVAVLSASFLQAIVQGQWSPLLTAGVILPWVSITWIAKPTVALALFAGWHRKHAIVGGVALMLVSLAIEPSWPLKLWEGRAAAIHRAPVLRPGGILLLLALLRWRLPEGRLLAALACVPHSLGVYESLPLFLIPQRKGHAYALALLTYAAVFLIELLPTAALGVVEGFDRRWVFMFTLVYLPALILLLRRPDPAPLPHQSKPPHDGPGQRIGAR